jgi:rubrerythrin
MNLRTARKKGTTTLKGGNKQQVWHCRECGGTWQTDSEGKIVQKKSKKSRETIRRFNFCKIGV